MRGVLITLCLLTTCLVAAQSKFTINADRKLLSLVLEDLKRQHANIIWDWGSSPSPEVTVHLSGVRLERIVDTCISGFYLKCKRIGKQFIIRSDGIHTSLIKPLQGRVIGPDGDPIPRARVRIGLAEVMTNDEGIFTSPVGMREGKINLFHTNYVPLDMVMNNRGMATIVLQPRGVILGQVTVHANGIRPLSVMTGPSSRLKASEIARQPVTNLMGALEGRVPGLAITQNNGVPGSAYKVLIRGQNSLGSPSPLIIVEGVPIDVGSQQTVIGSGGAQGASGASPLNGIEPSNIASIEVLKDAAETAIYGCRGSNGVILIHLKRGIPGGERWSIDISRGWNKPVNEGKYMNIRQYRAMREEAAGNDGQSLTPPNDPLPELTNWDSTRQTDWRKWIMGNTAVIQNARLSLTGGDTNTNYIVNGSYHWENTVFRGHTAYEQANVYGNLNHRSFDGKLRLNISAMCNRGITSLPVEDPSAYVSLAPDAPAFRDSSGKLQWNYKNVSYTNLEALQYNTYHGAITEVFGHLQIDYEPAPRLIFKGSLGDNFTGSSELSRWTLAGQDPSSNPIGSMTYTDVTGNSLSGEIMAEYTHCIKKLRLEELLGATWQQELTDVSQLMKNGYTSDVLMNLGTGAAQTSSTENRVEYRYEAAYARLSMNYAGKWITTASVRKDGSSRFGPANQLGVFWALGGAWVFTEEKLFKQISWLSLGKLRGSTGTTGNDQIGDNRFASTYSATSSTRGYQGLQGTYPSNFYNQNLSWELNHKSEIAMDLGFFHNRAAFSVSAYRNLASNLLVQDILPAEAGLPTVYHNRPVKVMNKGLEFSLQLQSSGYKALRWSSELTLTIPENRLLSFPGLASSNSASMYIVGKSLTELNAWQTLGVDRTTGYYTFRDVNGDKALDKNDLLPGGNLDVRYYGGLDLALQYKRWQLEVFCEYRGQRGLSPFTELFKRIVPGAANPALLNNLPVQLLARWRKTGDQAPFQRLTLDPNGIVADTLMKYTGSNAQSVDASFFRWKNLSLSYRLPGKVLSEWHCIDARVYLQVQNLLTITRYPVTDPETQNPLALPPMRTVIGGFQINF